MLCARFSTAISFLIVAIARISILLDLRLTVLRLWSGRATRRAFLGNYLDNFIPLSSDDDLVNANNFFRIQKIRVADIKLASHGAFDIFEVYPQFGTKTIALSRCLNDFAIHIGCIGKPEGEFDNSSGCYRIKLQRRDIEQMQLSQAISLLPSGYLSPMVIGCTADGLPLIIDQGSIPNTLIAGAPGSGKSTLLKVMIENFIASNVAVTIIDPKMVDFAAFKDRDGCIVVSDLDDVPEVLDELISEMNNVYAALTKRNMVSVADNNKTLKPRIKPRVIIIDEWANLMLHNKENINKILILSQKGRAAGISIVLATQRPSSSILPGKIKANFSGRIAMRVSSEMESRIILDSSHAAHISGPGLAYYLDQNHQKPVYFRVAQNDLVEMVQKTKKTFWQNLKGLVF